MNMLSILGTVQAEEALAQMKDVATQAGQTLQNLQGEPQWGWSEMLWTSLFCICLVFFVLVLLVGVMKLFGYIFVKKTPDNTPSKPTVQQGQIHEEEIAAIVTALKLFKSDLHDRESEVLTIMSIKRAYSPWNSKIHGLTQLPDRK